MGSAEAVAERERGRQQCGDQSGLRKKHCAFTFA
jgi:hypothetical protein